MRTHLIRYFATIAVVTGACLAGCGDKAEPKDSPSAAASGKPASSSANNGAKPVSTATTAAATAEPKPNLPEKGPWEAVKITYLKDDPSDGSPLFKMENLGAKTVTVCFIDFYGYDEGGKQVVHKALSWNGSLKGGQTDDKLYTSKVDGVKTWEATYHGIKFEGDAESTMDDKRAPAQRPKGG